MNLDKEKKSIISLLVIIAAAALAYYLINPIIDDLKDLQLQTAAKRMEIKQMQQKIENLQVLQRDFQEQSKQMELLGIALPTEDQIPEVLIQLDTIAAKNGLSVSSIQPTATVDKTAAEVAVTMSVKGEFNQFKSFFDSLDKNLRFVKVKNINLTPNATTSTSGEETSKGVAANLTLGVIKAVSAN